MKFDFVHGFSFLEINKYFRKPAHIFRNKWCICYYESLIKRDVCPNANIVLGCVKSGGQNTFLLCVNWSIFDFEKKIIFFPLGNILLSFLNRLV